MSLYIIQDLANNRHKGLVMKTWEDDDCIAYVDKNDKIVRYISLSANSDVENINIQSNQKNMIVPMIPATDENFLIFINGVSGNGKSLFGYNFALQYMDMYDGDIFYISNKNKSVDQNMSKLDLTQLSIDDIKKFDINEFSNSLFIIDDVDDGDIHKFAMNVVNSIANLGREYSVSCIYITHNNSKLNETRMSKECHMYITFPKNLHDNSIISKMKIPYDTVDIIEETKSSYVCFNKICDYIITDKIIMKF